MLYKSIYDHIDFIRALNTQGKGEGQTKTGGLTSTFSCQKIAQVQK